MDPVRQHDVTRLLAAWNSLMPLVEAELRRLAGGYMHLIAIAAQYMRQILVEHARRKRSPKRGPGSHPVTLDALNELARFDEGTARVVEIAA